jgi:hypothetical protein
MVLRKPIAVLSMFLKISVYALHSDSRNLFVVYRIWAYG